MIGNIYNTLILSFGSIKGNDGGVQGARAIINAFAAISNIVTLISPSDEPSDTASSNGLDHKIKMVPIGNNKSLYKKFFNYFFLKRNRFYDIFKKEIISNKYNIAVFVNSKGSYGLIDLAHLYGLKVVVIHENYEYMYVHDNITDNNIISKLYLYLVRKIESEAVEKSDIGLGRTLNDVNTLEMVYGKGRKSNIYRIGAFKYIYGQSSINRNTSKEFTFSITGVLSALQTFQPLKEFIIDYYPLIKQHRPEANMVVAGRNPKEDLVKLCDESGIKLIANPEQMDPIVNKSHYYICPTYMGSGIKMRIMDAFKLGIPVLAHEKSSIGYEPFVEKGYMLIYKDKKTFEDVLEKIYHTNYNHEDIINLYNQEFSLEGAIERLKNILTNHL